MNIFPEFQFHPDYLNQFYNDFKKTMDNFIHEKYIGNEMFFTGWITSEIETIQAAPKRWFSLFFAFDYINEELLDKEKKQLLKEYKKLHAKVTKEFLDKYIALLETDSTESDILDLLLDYGIAGFNGVRKLKQEEYWLKEQLHKIGE